MMAIWESILRETQNVGLFLLGHPLRLVLALLIPFALLARQRQVYPSRAMMLWFLLPLGIALLTPWVADLANFLWFVNLVLTLVMILDLFSLPRTSQFSAIRVAEKVASLGKPHAVELNVRNQSRRTYAVQVIDDLPDTFEASPHRFEIRSSANTEARMNYKFVATRRGWFGLRKVHLEIDSAWGFWRRIIHCDCPQEIHVYPDLKQISEFDLLARTNRLSLLGVRRSRKVGQDHDFERLRDYTRDDNHRHIDWRSSARRQKLTVKDFQSNQDQQIIFMVDCGRMMTGLSGKFTLLDHALNAMLMLAYIALRQGDSVGLILFGDRVHGFVPPRTGVQHINRLLHAVFDRHAASVESRYDEAFLYLRHHCRKRSLVVLITNVIDEINAHQIQGYLKRSTGRHLPLAVLLRDRELFGPLTSHLTESVASGPRTGGPEFARPSGETATLESRPWGAEQARDDLFVAGVAAEIALWRHQVLKNLIHQGVLTIDAFPEDLSAALINEYLQIKARHLL